MGEAIRGWMDSAYAWFESYRSYIVPAVLAASAAFWSFKDYRRKRRAREIASAQDRRIRILTDPLTKGASSDPDDPVLIVMDVALEDGVASLFATYDGDARLYLSNGKTVEGAGTQLGIRNAAMAFVREAAAHRAAFARTTGFLFPEPGNVKFYVRTTERVYVMQRSLANLIRGDDALSSFFEAGQALLSRLRENVR